MSIKKDDIQVDYTINLSGSAIQQMDANEHNSLSAPFRLYPPGPFNIKRQSADFHYKVFIGEQKT
tara:strand:- start:79 stop:273 length:195 start_codon:yes stop_codon:yes gene_type:complete